MPLRATVLCMALFAVLAAGCTEPDVTPEDGTAEGDASRPAPTFTEEDADLRAQIERLEALVTAAQEGLADTQEADALPAAVGGAEQALRALLADGETSPSDGDGLLPARTVDRSGSTVPSDLLTETLTLAQDRGGVLGTRTAEVLRDPIAGDLGAWQRDAGGMVDLARTTAASSTDIAVLEPAILELVGEGTRALAWTFVAVDADDLDLAQAAAERASAHLDVIEVALDELDADSGATTS
jgi:hypothetical protein